jgi:4-amino-4-deoxy-L-arabinose transferase-like glycosyltransferase
MTVEYRSPLTPDPSEPALKPLYIVITLAIGAVLVLLAGNDMNPLRWMVVLSALGLSVVPFVNGGIAKLLDKLRDPTPRGRRMVAIGAGAMAALYLWVTATIQNRSFVPRMQDECAYLISTQLLAHGHLWMPQHPMADFFESFFVIVKPVYCSIYFPGTAIFFAPAVWLGWQMWILPLILSGGIVAMLYRVIAELVDGVAGILAVFWIIALSPFRTFSVMVMSHLPMLFLGLLIVWAWLNWRRERKLHWALLIGVFSGWAAITRPADALAYAMPIGIAMALCLWRHGRKKWLTTAIALIIGAAPFLGLQLVFNHGVTGRWLESPYAYSLNADQPGSAFGFQKYDPAAKPASKLLEKQDYYTWCRTMLEQHQFPKVIKRWFVRINDRGGLNNAYFTIIADNTMPGRLLLLLLPVGALAIVVGEKKRLAVAGTLVAFCFVYFFNPYFLEHYPLVVSPAIMLIVFAGARRLVAGRWSRQLGVPITLAILALSLTSLYEFKQMTEPKEGEVLTDGMLEAPSPIALVNAEIPAKIPPNAVVLFGPRRASFFEEPVYNVDVADIDKAPIIRAHDLGLRDMEIIRYYAERQPDRKFYICDARAIVIDVLGTARELKEKLDRREPIKTLASSPAPGNP